MARTQILAKARPSQSMHGNDAQKLVTEGWAAVGVARDHCKWVRKRKMQSMGLAGCQSTSAADNDARRRFG